MGRLERAAPILHAAAEWRERCLRDGRSLFTDERLWTREYFEQLRIHFVENPDDGADPFYEKLRRQLDPAPLAAKRLWAEMTWAYYLVVGPGSVKPKTKSDQIMMVWEWSGTALPVDHPMLSREMLTGIANPGIAYGTLRWREFRFFVSANARLDVARQRAARIAAARSVGLRRLDRRSTARAGPRRATSFDTRGCSSVPGFVRTGPDAEPQEGHRHSLLP